MKLLGGDWSKADILAAVGVVIAVCGIIVAHLDVDPKPLAPAVAPKSESAAPALSALEIEEIDTAKAGLRRLRLTVEPIRETQDVAFNAALTIKENDVSFVCPEAGCPDGSVGDATGVLVSNPAVQRPNNMTTLRKPGFQQYLLLDQIVFTQFQQTLGKIEDNTVPKDTQDYRPLLERARAKCRLDASVVDNTLARLSRLRGLEQNSLFWGADPGKPLNAELFHVFNPDRQEQFGHFLISIAMASGRSYEQTNTLSVREMTSLVAAEYRDAYGSLMAFERACEALKAPASTQNKVP